MDSDFRNKCIEEAIELCGQCIAEDASPRPKVAAVLADDNRVLATAYRGELGQGDHAEFTLLKRKFIEAPPHNSHLFVTLEPCSQRGPGKIACADHIIESGIKKVTIGVLDPNPQIYGRGQARLMEAGVSIDFFDASHASQLNNLNLKFNSLFSDVRNSVLRRMTPAERYLVIFCGPSSSGKDTLLGRIRGRMIDLGVRSNFVQKFTTRLARPGEQMISSEQWTNPSSEYNFVSIDEFNRNEDITGKYEKYGHYYGFSSRNLLSKAKQDAVLFGIFGDIEAVPANVEEIENLTGRKCLVYLLRTGLPELEARLSRRQGFEVANVTKRLEELRSDYALIERLIRDRGNFKYYTNANVDNPDSVSEIMLRDILFQMNMLQ